MLYVVKWEWGVGVGCGFDFVLEVGEMLIGGGCLGEFLKCKKINNQVCIWDGMFDKVEV